MFGIGLRVYSFLVNRSLWLDEAALANNILLPNTLLNNAQFGQLAPPLFKALSLFNVNLFGMNEYALRLLPLLCGVFSVVLFYLVIKKLFSKVIVLFLMCLFSINPIFRNLNRIVLTYLFIYL